MSKLLMKRVTFITLVVILGIIYYHTVIKDSLITKERETALEYSLPVTEGNQTELEVYLDEATKDQSIEKVTTEETKNYTDDEAVYIHVCGAVRQPGVYEMVIGDRVVDAILAAGGFHEEAAEDVINQAELLVDGARLYVPTTEEIDASGYLLEEHGVVANKQYGLVENAVNQIDDRININTAGKEALMTLPGIGEAKAESILAYRKEHGNFITVEELQNVPGIKKASFNKMKDYITIGR